MAEVRAFAEDTKPLLGENATQPDFVFLRPGEADKWNLIPNLDEFFTKVYEYYTGKGFMCIVLNRLVNVLILGFIIAFSAVLFLLVDWDSLFDERVLVFKSLGESNSNSHYFLVFCFGIFGIVWVVELIRFFYQLKGLLEIKTFVNKKLMISEADIESMRWCEVLQRLINLQKTNRFCIVKDELTALDIVNRIMRKENYLIALLNNDVIDLRLTFPVIGERIFFTQTLEWNISLLILNNIFSVDSSIHREYLNPSNKQRLAQRMKKHLLWLSVANLLLSPCIVLFLIVYTFFRYGEELQSRPSRVGTRQWSPYARWKLREYNELPHILQNRLNFSMPFAQSYIDNFPDYRLSALARLVSFVVGAMAAVLLLIGLIDEGVLVEVHVLSKSLIFYVGIFGTVLAITRSFLPAENTAFDPDDVLKKVVEHIHYFPKHWKDHAHTWKVRKEFSFLFQYRISLFAQELLGVFITPYIMWFSMSTSIEKILDFIRENTVHEEGVGHICAFGLFNFRKREQKQTETVRALTKHGKMEKSFINFKVTYPEWVPTPSGEEMLENLQAMNPDLPPLSSSMNELQRSQDSGMAESSHSRPLSEGFADFQVKRSTRSMSSSQSGRQSETLNASVYYAALDRYYESHLTPTELKEMGARMNYDSNV